MQEGRASCDPRCTLRSSCTSTLISGTRSHGRQPEETPQTKEQMHVYMSATTLLKTKAHEVRHRTVVFKSEFAVTVTMQQCFGKTCAS
jgi:hypothetical protein